MLKTDNMLVKDKNISVALSRPPERKNPSENKPYPPVARFRSHASNSSLER